MSDIKNELTTEHDIYISLGLKHPMKPMDCRDLIDSLIVDNFTLDSWGTHTKDEWIDVVNECQGKVDSLLTTIESQKEEIDKLQKDNKLLTIVNDRYTKSAMAQCPPYYNNEGVYCHGDGTPIKGHTDYKAITELAVKGLQFYADEENYDLEQEEHYIKVTLDRGDNARTTLSEIEKLSHE